MKQHLFMLKPMESLITITSIARKVGDTYELDLTLRNITTEEYLLGVYHPHAEYHHIKSRISA